MRKLLPPVLIALWVLAWAGPGRAQSHEGIVIGSKKFAESWILGEALADLARPFAPVRHKSNMGSTDIVYAALKTGAVDVYPDYTGTIQEAILKAPGRLSLDEMRKALAPEGIGISDSLGFNDGYGITVTEKTAQKLGLRKISDLAAHPELRPGFTHEFLERKDGWPGLAARYGLHFSDVRGIQHDLAYQALANGQIDVTEVYTTDAQIQRFALRVLEDDRVFFPRYDCVLLYRLDLPSRYPDAWKAMQRLVGAISEPAMIRANALVVIEKKTQQDAAGALLGGLAGQTPAAVGGQKRPDVARQILDRTGEHLRLVGISLLLAAVVGIPLGILASRAPALAAGVLAVTGVLQTIPSLALLAFLIPVLSQVARVGHLKDFDPLGAAPLIALFLYSLLPIVRNTYVGLTSIPPNLAEAADALGLAPAARLFRVNLPLASPSIMAGLKTSAVINVGTATLAALVGAGGLGEPILRGMDTLNNDLILQGAIPAAVLALLMQGLFDLLDRLVIPRGLRLRTAAE